VSYRREEVDLGMPSPGVRQSLVFHRYGDPGARPKAYIQASIHADEIPAMMAAHHLLQLLHAADSRGSIRGEIVLVPYANPIGLGQWIDDRSLGRHELRGGLNFNRSWPDLEEVAADRLDGSLTDDEEANVSCIRKTLLTLLDERQNRHLLDRKRHALLRESLTADYVLDVHCDDEALLHLYTLPQHWEEIGDLAAELGAHVVLLDEGGSIQAFDEVNSRPWLVLQRRFPKRPIPLACVSATVELRGRADVSDALGRQDAIAIHRYLTRRRLIADALPDVPALTCGPTEIEACEVPRAPAAGILAYKVRLGSEVEAGEVIAELVDPYATPGAARLPIRASAAGKIFTRRSDKYVLAHHPVAKIAGKTALAGGRAYSGED